MSSVLRLISLAAIWGASFLFMRIAAPSLGAVWLAAGRVAWAALFLAVVGLWLRQALQVRSQWRHYLLLGLFNSALPFLLFSYAAQQLSASLMSIINATAPLWGAVFAAVLARQLFSAKVALGLLLGVVGVALLVGLDPVLLQVGTGVAVLACLGAAACYGVASVYAKVRSGVGAFSNAHGSMWAATLLLLPWLPSTTPVAMPNAAVWLAVLALGVLCSGIAYILYFRLVADLGAASALSVTFLIPLFGVLWGHVFLHEPVGWNTALGALVVIAGTVLVTGFSPAALRRKVVQHDG